MKNTLENKEKFFALYWGFEFTGSNQYGEYMPDTWRNFPKYIDKQYLILKPLSSISDEDAKELIKLDFQLNKGCVDDIINIVVSVSKKPSRPNAVSIEAVISHKRWNDFVERIFIGEDTRATYGFIDYLRSKDYAVPWMGLSVKELVNRGWVKLKSK